MLAYDRVRISLRGHEHLDVKLTEIPKQQDNLDLFPPLIERKPSDIRQGIVSQIDWETYKSVPMLLWYPPVALPPFHPDQKLARKIFHTKFQEENCLFREMQDFSSIKQHLERSKYLTSPREKLLSGECDYPFRLRICGINNIERLLAADMHKHASERATYNGVNCPHYITKENARQREDVLYSTAQGKSSGQEAEGRDRLEKNAYYKLIRQSDTDKGQLNEKQFLKCESNFSHGALGSKYLNGLAKYFGLNFAPYLISVEVMLYYGSSLLNAHARQETRKVPFQFNPKWYEHISFSSINVSNLPQEARLCFNVTIYDDKCTQKQIISSTSLNVFDEYGQFQQGAQDRNLWPFYEADPRLPCMSEYWHLTTEQRAQVSAQTQEIRSQMTGTPPHECAAQNKIERQLGYQYFSKLVVQMPEFELPLYYSIRIEKYLEEMGQDQSLQLNIMDENSHAQEWNSTPITDDLARLQQTLNIDPLKMNQLTEQEKFILLKCRHHYKSMNYGIQLFLSAIDWAQPEQLREARNMLQQWSAITMEDALPILGCNFPDEKVSAAPPPVNFAPLRRLRFSPASSVSASPRGPLLSTRPFGLTPPAHFVARSACTPWSGSASSRMTT